jgi:hypothetical protein
VRWWLLKTNRSKPHYTALSTLSSSTIPHVESIQVINPPSYSLILRKSTVLSSSKMWLIYLFFSLTLAPRAATGQLTDAATMSASIRSEAGYSLLPGCIKECIWDIGRRETNDIGGDLAAHLSCSRPYPNGCYCRGASATVAYSFLTECFNFLCTTPAGSDVNSGISIYTSYCSTALGAAYTPNATPEPAPEDDSPSTTAGPTTGSGECSLSVSSSGRVINMA